MNTGFKFPSDNGDIFNTWTNPANVYVDDANYAQVGGPGGDSSAQDYSVFSFGIPAGSIIDGIELNVQGGSTTGQSELRFEISGDGGSTWSSSKTAYHSSAGSYNDTLGDSTDLWGYTWNATKTGDSNFFLKAYKANSNNHNVYFIKIKIYYSSGFTPKIIIM